MFWKFWIHFHWYQQRTICQCHDSFPTSCFVAAYHLASPPSVIYVPPDSAQQNWFIGFTCSTPCISSLWLWFYRQIVYCFTQKLSSLSCLSVIGYQGLNHIAVKNHYSLFNVRPSPPSLTGTALANWCISERGTSRKEPLTLHLCIMSI